MFTAALSMMRESELRMITKDAVVGYYGSPAVRSVRQKLDPDLPVKHWWITEPVAHAIALAGKLSRHDEPTFAAVTGAWAGEGFASIAVGSRLAGGASAQQNDRADEECCGHEQDDDDQRCPAESAADQLRVVTHRWGSSLVQVRRRMAR
ncbi:hypothetical protein [Plantactinospora sonchi]|uniref:Uncharacterized protein n=1 Tax=Plantactinospora sonchi TaxID=1544735 RepID=A0ABU7S1K0_9ACTN